MAKLQYQHSRDISQTPFVDIPVIPERFIIIIIYVKKIWKSIELTVLIRNIKAQKVKCVNSPTC